MLIVTILVSSVGCSAQSETPQILAGKRLFGEEAFTITYRTTVPSLGAGAVTMTEHVRNWGYQSVKLYPGERALKTLAENGRFYRFDPETGQAYWQEDTPTQNLMSLIDQEADRDFGYRRSRFMFGGQPTGEAAVFAGHTCSFYQAQTSSPMLTVRVCMTSWGAALYVETQGEVESTQVATEVRIGDRGPDDVFAFDRESALPASALQ